MSGSVLLVDDQPSTYQSLVQAIGDKKLRILTAARTEEALQILQTESVDVVISSAELENDPQEAFLVRIAAEYPHTIRIVLAEKASAEAAIFAINEGKVFRFLRKPIEYPVLRRALDEALSVRALNVATKAFLDAALPRPIPNDVAARPPSWKTSALLNSPSTAMAPGKGRNTLSSRELEVLSLLAGGRNVAQIASVLFISVHTVRNHLKAMYRKLGLHSQAELVAWFRVLPAAETA